MQKRQSFILGIFDLYYTWHNLRFIPGLIKTIKMYSSHIIQKDFLLFMSGIISPIIQIIFILSLLVSGILYFLNKKAAYIMYFPQFVFRFLYVMPTFAIILKVCNMNYGSTLYKVLLIVCAILEITRLFATIRCLINENHNK